MAVRWFLQRPVFRAALSRLSHQDFRPDYYSALGVNKGADIKTIKLAYYRLAKKFHPDNNQTEDAKFMFRFIAEAYEVLTDDKKRQDYDMYGTAFTTTGGMTSGPQRPQGHQNYSAEELFEKIFKDSAKGGPKFVIQDDYNYESYFGHGACHEIVVDIAFEDACLGGIFQVPVNLKVICYKCDGSKSEMGYTGNICPYCEGTGIETEKVGHILTRKTCAYCDGSKIFIKYKCNECVGTGVTIIQVMQSVTIPPGVENGQLLKVPIEKRFVECQSPGQNDYYFVKVTYEDSNYFRRDGIDLYTEADMSLSQALLGGKLLVRGLKKKYLLVDIPPGGVSSHNMLVAVGEGLNRQDYLPPGNHFVNVGIEVPKPEELSKDQLEILRKFSLTETIENGLVENGVEPSDGHRYRVNVIEAANISRKFAHVAKTNREKLKDEMEIHENDFGRSKHKLY